MKQQDLVSVSLLLVCHRDALLLPEIWVHSAVRLDATVVVSDWFCMKSCQ